MASVVSPDRPLDPKESLTTTLPERTLLVRSPPRGTDMLAIISDLHFCDGTATDKNVDPAAFKLALSEVYESAASLAKKRGSRTRLDLVFLGDVFDFLRTERWFEARDGSPVPLASRPWGSVDALTDAVAPPACIKNAHAILDQILEQNKDALSALRGETLPPPDDVVVRRIYLLGNHDRLCLHDEVLHQRCRDALAAADERTLEGEGIHPHHLEMPQYGLLARHGHEWDDWNFERYDGSPPSHYNADDYLPTPIGDPITTELAARLPWELARQLLKTTLTQAEREGVVARMQHIEDVRPTLAALQWAFYEANQIHGRMGDSAKKAQLTVALNETVRALAENFRALPFFQGWEKRHHAFLHLDSAGELKAVLDALLVVDVRVVATLAQLFERYGQSREPRDTCREGAALEDLKTVGTAGLRFVVYGHTHEPLQVALRAGATQDLYLNSGTFRGATFRTADEAGFLGWDRMTYLTLYTQEEQAAWNKTAVGPGFDAWTGNRNRNE